MDLKALCQALAVEANVDRTGATPATTVNQTGEFGSIVRWIKQSALELDGMEHWNYLWERPQLTMPADGTGVLAATVPVSRYLTASEGSFYVPVAGQLGTFPNYLPWDRFKTMHPFIQSGPSWNTWTIAPDNSIRVDIAPTAPTNFFIERFKEPVELVGDAAVPLMPLDLHMAVVWRALIKYANFDESGVQRETAVDELARLMSLLRRRCLPVWRPGAPLGADEGL